MALPILNLDIRWRWVVRLTFRPLCSRGKRSQFILKRKLGGCQTGWMLWRRENCLYLTEIEQRLSCCPTRGLVTIAVRWPSAVPGVGRSRCVRSRPDCRFSSVADQTCLTCSPLADYKSDDPWSYVTCLYNSVQDSQPRPYRSPSGLPNPPWQPAA